MSTSDATQQHGVSVKWLYCSVVCCLTICALLAALGMALIGYIRVDGYNTVNRQISFEQGYFILLLNRQMTLSEWRAAFPAARLVTGDDGKTQILRVPPEDVLSDSYFAERGYGKRRQDFYGYELEFRDGTCVKMRENFKP